MTEHEIREYTRISLSNELFKLENNYMKLYDKYHSEETDSDCAFIHDLVDSIKGISAILEVYTRDNKIHPNYALEKLKYSKSIVDSCYGYFKRKSEK